MCSCTSKHTVTLSSGPIGRRVAELLHADLFLLAPERPRSTSTVRASQDAALTADQPPRMAEPRDVPGVRVLEHPNKLGFGTFRPLTSPAGSVGTTRFTYSPHDPTSGRSSRASPRAASDQGVTIAEDGTLDASFADLAAQPLPEYCMVKPEAAPIVVPQPVIAVLKPCAWMRFRTRTPNIPPRVCPSHIKAPDTKTCTCEPRPAEHLQRCCTCAHPRMAHSLTTRTCSPGGRFPSTRRRQRACVSRRRLPSSQLQLRFRWQRLPPPVSQLGRSRKRRQQPPHPCHRFPCPLRAPHRRVQVCAQLAVRCSAPAPSARAPSRRRVRCSHHAPHRCSRRSRL